MTTIWKAAEPADSASVPPRERLLGTAASLFYAEGIRAVGIDRLIAESRITKATFYRHFPAKDDLVVAYLKLKDQELHRLIEPALAGLPPREGLDKFFDATIEYADQPGFRGCPFMNAAAEYPDASHPVRLLVAAHRRWLHSLLRERLVLMGHATPREGANLLLMLYDGALASGYLDDPGTVREALHSTVAGILQSRQ